MTGTAFSEEAAAPKGTLPSLQANFEPQERWSLLARRLPGTCPYLEHSVVGGRLQAGHQALMVPHLTQHTRPVLYEGHTRVALCAASPGARS